jgi:hypothetical protein
MIRRGVRWYEASSCGRPVAQAGLTFAITTCLLYCFDIPGRELSCHTQADFICRQTIVTNNHIHIFKLKVLWVVQLRHVPPKSRCASFQWLINFCASRLFTQLTQLQACNGVKDMIPGSTSGVSAPADRSTADLCANTCRFISLSTCSSLILMPRKTGNGICLRQCY